MESIVDLHLIFADFCHDSDFFFAAFRGALTHRLVVL